MSIALTARHVVHRFPAASTPALDDVSVDVGPGQALALVGESGSGKTTLLRCFNRMIQPESGEVSVGDGDVRGQNPIALRRRLGYVQQRGGLLPHWTVRENVGLVLRAMGRGEPASVNAALEMVGLDPARFGSRYPQELSGGQAQRVALARALAARPQAILLDEPFGALDAITRAEMHEAFDGVRRRLGITVLLVTHDLGEGARLADTIAVMRAGRIEQQGRMATLRDAPATPYVRALVARALASARVLQSVS